MLEIYTNSNFDFMQEWYKGNKELKELDKKVKETEKKIAELENPSRVLLDKLVRQKAKLEDERREFVNDMLELD
jgi:predicted  nucleic acid-binding Zn-ribbon protein